jgi:hypothetical protein
MSQLNERAPEPTVVADPSGSATVAVVFGGISTWTRSSDPSTRQSTDIGP